MKCLSALCAALCGLCACGQNADEVDRRAPQTSDDAGSRQLPDGGNDSAAAADGSPEMSDGSPEMPDGSSPTPPDSSDAAGGWPDGIEPLACNGAGARYVTAVPAYEFGPGQDNGRSSFPEIVFGPPKGQGCCMGSLDVVSIGNGGWVVVEFENNAIVDQDGPDFIVFENAFFPSSDAQNPFAELATVAVSENGTDWVEFPCTAVAYPYGACAGWHPVYANPDENTIDPTDPTAAGGDAFDLADIGVTTARFVKITDRIDLTGTNGVFDLDAVAIVHPMCP